ncbi:uncharacterized protein [Nicotiana sylvestris]|uniref:uncharacterized protein n=1 Tax=Nicotiana sylvestris TaxID=4096 RepID=UPI00388CCAC8
MVDNHKQLHEKLPFSLLGYRTIVRTSTGATPYMLVYGTEAVIPAKVEIPSLRIIQEVELSDAEWIRSRYEQLALYRRKKNKRSMSWSTLSEQNVQSLGVLTGGALILAEMDGEVRPKPINSDTVKRYYI